MRCMGAAAVCEKDVNSWAELVLTSMEARDLSRGLPPDSLLGASHRDLAFTCDHATFPPELWRRPVKTMFTTEPRSTRIKPSRSVALLP